MQYFANVYAEEDVDEKRFEAEDDEAAIELAKQRFGGGLSEICRVEADGNWLIWEREPTLYLKFVLDGCESIPAAVATLEGLIADLQQMESEGLELVEVDGGHLRFQRSDEELAALDGAS